MEFSHFVAIYMKIAGKFGALKLGKSQRFICYRNEKPQRLQYKFVIRKEHSMEQLILYSIGNHVKEFFISKNLNTI